MPITKCERNEGRGCHVKELTVVDGVDFSVVSWFDNKVVSLSNFAGSEPITEVGRLSKSQNEYIQISHPKLVQIYNRHVGGVDLLDSLLGYY